MLLLVTVTGNILTANEGLSRRKLDGDEDNIDCKQAILKMPFRVVPQSRGASKSSLE